MYIHLIFVLPLLIFWGSLAQVNGVCVILTNSHSFYARKCEAKITSAKNEISSAILQ